MSCMCPRPTAFYRREQEGVDSDDKSEKSEKQKVFDEDGDAEFGKKCQKSDKKEVR